MKRLLLATTNQGKVREFSRALTEVGIEAVGLDTLKDQSPVAETGSTFEENARLKAEQFSLRQHTGPIVVGLLPIPGARHAGHLPLQGDVHSGMQLDPLHHRGRIISL